VISLQDPFGFLRFLKTLHWRMITLSTLCSKESAVARMKMVHNFARYLLAENARKGPDYVIAYLKCAQLALSKFLAREKVGSLSELNPKYIFPCLRHGLPKIIGPRDRVSIRHGNPKIVIMWMSIFGIFRVLAGTYKLALATIVEPFGGNQRKLDEMVKYLEANAIRHLHCQAPFHWRKPRPSSPLDAKLLKPQTSSPSSGVS
jgi:hypothetical protein